MQASKRKAAVAPAAQKQGDNKLIEEIIPHFEKKGVVKTERDGWTVLCPFHDDTNPSLKIFSDGGFVCRSCGAKGSHASLARELGLAADGQEHEFGKAITAVFQERLGTEPGKLTRFGIFPSGESGMLFEVSGSAGSAVHGRYDPTSEPRYKLPAGSIKGKLFGLSRLPRTYEGQVFVVEGVFDALTLLRDNLPAVAVLGNANAPADVFKALRDVGISHAVFAFDGDDAGRNYTQAYIEYFSARKEILTEAIVLDRGDINDAFREGRIKEAMRVDDPLLAWAKTAKVSSDVNGPVRFSDAVGSRNAGLRHVALVKAFEFFRTLNPLQRSNVEAFKEFANVSEVEWNELFREYAIRKDTDRLRTELQLAATTLTSAIERDPVEAFEQFKARGDKLVSASQPQGAPWIGANLVRIVNKIRNAKEGIELVRGLPQAKAFEGDLVVLAGPSGWGKSTLAIDIASSLAEHFGVFYASYELPEQMLLSKFIAANTRRSYLEIRDEIRSGMEPYIPEATLKNIAIIESMPSIEALARYVRSFGTEVGALVVDYDQLAPVEKDTANEERRVAEISGVCKRLALEQNIIVILLSQLTKKSAAGGKTSWDLRYSAQKENDASLVIRIEPEDEEDSGAERKVSLHLTKNRHGSPMRKVPYSIDFLRCYVERRDAFKEEVKF